MLGLLATIQGPANPHANAALRESRLVPNAELVKARNQMRWH
jgi:hypothetical protein